jgi:predicted membrane protein
MKNHYFVSYSFPITIIFLLRILFVSPEFALSEEFTETFQSKVSAGGASEFHLTTPANLGGQVYLEVWDEEDCQVKFTVWARAKTTEQAKKFTDMVDLELDREEEVVDLRLTTPHPAPWEGSNYGISATLYIFIPHDFKVETNTQAFNLDITGPIPTIDIQNQYGKIQVSDVSEETKISSTYGQVDLENIRGALNVETSYNSISLRHADTDDEKAFLKTSYGKIDVEKFEGQLDASTVYSSIDASDITLRDGRNEFKTVYSKIDLDITEMQDAQLYVQNTYGNVNLTVPEDLSAQLKFTVGHGGKIITRGIIIQPTVLNQTTLEGICGDEESEIEVDINGIGQIQLEGK